MARDSERIKFKTLISYTDSNGQNLDYNFCSNWSCQGMFIATNVPLSVGSTIHLSLSMPHNRDQFKIKACVKWNRQVAASGAPCGMGVEFQNVSPSDAHKIQKYIHYYKSTEEEKK